MGTQRKPKTFHSKTHHEHQKGKMYVISFTNQGPAIQIAVPKGKSVNAKFYKGKVLHKLKKYFLNRRQKLVSVVSGCCMTMLLIQEKVVELPHPPYSPDLAPCDFFLFPRLKKHLAGRKYQTRKNLGSAIFQCLNSIPQKDYENAFENWIKRLKLCAYHMVASILTD